MTTRTLTSLLIYCLLAVVPSGYAQEQESNWYQIEVLLFAQQNGYQRSNELWRDAFTPDDTRNPITLSTPDNADLSHEPYLLLPRQLRSLNSAAQRIQQAPDLRLLSHLAWRQPVSEKSKAKPVLIQTGKQFGSQFELEGTLTISLEGYLNTHSELFFSKFKAADQAYQLDWNEFNAEIPLSDSAARQQQQAEPHRDNAKLATSPNAEFVRVATARLNQSRRMRSGELHYIDHPLFGIVIRISPYKLPNPALQNNELNPTAAPVKQALPADNKTG